MIPPYVDISHFRAPYKNAVFGAYEGRAPGPGLPPIHPGPRLGSPLRQGPTLGPMVRQGPRITLRRHGFGQVATPATSAAFVNVEPDGTQVYKPEVVQLITAQLAGLSVIPIDGNNAQLDVRVDGDTRQLASDWVKQALAAGKSVLYGSNAGIAGAMLPMTGAITDLLKSVSDHAGELNAAGNGGVYAVFARPSMTQAAMATIGPVGAALIALGAAGLVYYVWTSRKGAAR